MKKILLGLTAVLALTIAHGQTTFQKTYGNIQYSTTGRSIIQKGGEYFLAGTWGVSTPYGNGFIIKVDSFGDTLWTKQLPFSSSVIIPTLDGGFRTSVSKFSSLGNLMWDNLYIIPSGPYGSGALLDGYEKIIQTKDSGYVFLHPTGMCPGPACGTHYAVLKTDKNGNATWFKDYGNNSLTTTLFEGFTPKNIIQTLDNNLLICGSYYFQSDNTSGNPHLLKINQNGDTLWSKGYTFDTLSSIPSMSIGAFYEILPTQDSGFVVVGNGIGNDSLYSTIVCKINSLGNPLWAKRYILNSDAIYEPKITQTSDGGYALTGDVWDLSVTNSDIGLIKINSNGDTLWTKTYGTIPTVEWGNDIIETADGYLAITGGIDNTTGGDDAFLLIVDSLGNGCNKQYTNTSVTNITLTVTHPSLFTYPLLINDSIFSDSLKSIPVIKTVTCPPVVTEVQDFLNSELMTIFPNPFSSHTVLQTGVQLFNATLTAYNCFGQTVAQIKNINAQTITFNRDNLPSGLYFVRLIEEDKIIAVGKLVITD